MLLDLLPGAVFSSDRKYRYFLQRRINLWPRESKGTLVFNLLNGSKADETSSDPTLGKLCAYAGFCALARRNRVMRQFAVIVRGYTIWSERVGVKE